MLDQLLDDHRRILAAADQLEARLTPLAPNDVAGVARLRWALIRDILRHVAAEDGFADFAHARGTGMQAAEGRADGARLAPTGFARMLRSHVAQWSMASPIAAWKEFRQSVLALLAALRAQIAFEEADIYPELRLAERPRGRGSPSLHPALPGAMRGRY